MNAIASNRLSIYLIKETYLSHADILKDANTLNSKQIDGVGTLYYDKSHVFPPSWIEGFFAGQLSHETGLLSASAKAILLAEVETESGNNRIFAIPFGYGWTWLNPGTHEERFGLKVALNIVDPTSLRHIGKKSLASIPKDTHEQLSRAGEAADFGIDIEQDLILTITGRSKEESYGTTVSGKDAFYVSAKVNISNIQSFLKDCFDKYRSDAYKKDFGFIDQISEIRDPKVIEKLNDQLINQIKDEKLEKVWMAVPELVAWAEIAGFAYKESKQDLKDDINLPDFLDSLPESKKRDITLKTFEQKRIYCFSATSDEQRHGPWKAFNCLYCEIIDADQSKTYLLSNGKWYEVENDFATQVNADYQSLREGQASLHLPLYKHENEKDYNEKIGQANQSFCCMDGKSISFGGGYSKIEFCDLFTQDNKMIHIKRYGGSSVLSHLFNQGVISGELFLADKQFRGQVNDKLPGSHKLTNPAARPKPEDYDVIFGIISASSEPLDIPFFSKVALRNARRRLETFGYRVSLQKIGIEN